MSSSKLAYYERYPRDYIADTLRLSLEEHGAYTVLMDYQWLHGPVPSEPAALAGLWKVSLGKARKLWAVIEQYFPANASGERLNGRLERERVKAEERIAAASRRGAAGAQARWGRHSSGNAQASPEHSLSNSQQRHVAEAGAPSSSSSRGGGALPEAVEVELGPYLRSARFPDSIRATVRNLLNPEANPHFDAGEIQLALRQMQAKGREFSEGTLVRWCASNRNAGPRSRAPAATGATMAKMRRAT